MVGGCLSVVLCIPIRDSNRFDSIHLKNRFGFPKNRTIRFDHSLESVCNFDCDCRLLSMLQQQAQRQEK